MNKSLKHLTIIPDGNRRWAKNRGLPSWKGHQEGAKRIEEIIKTTENYQEIDYLTFWIASKDNLTKRSKIEVDFLYKLFTNAFQSLLKSSVISNYGVRVRILGEWRSFVPKNLAKTIKELEDKTENNTKRNLTFLLGYSGTEEMLAAMNLLLSREKKTIDDNDIKNALITADLPPVDLLIRTGGEPHNSSGFMMWHTANSQYYFTETLYPDFNKKELKKAIEEYYDRERRLGT
jgi:undecaprenyl diphosphate synthase